MKKLILSAVILAIVVAGCATPTPLLSEKGSSVVSQEPSKNSKEIKLGSDVTALFDLKKGKVIPKENYERYILATDDAFELKFDSISASNSVGTIDTANFILTTPEYRKNISVTLPDEAIDYFKSQGNLEEELKDLSVDEETAKFIESNIRENNYNTQYFSGVCVDFNWWCIATRLGWYKWSLIGLCFLTNKLINVPGVILCIYTSVGEDVARHAKDCLRVYNCMEGPSRDAF